MQPKTGNQISYHKTHRLPVLKPTRLQNGDEPNMEPVYNVTLIENTTDVGDIVEDDGVIWGNPENEEQVCASFEFDVPRQQLQEVPEEAR